MRRERQNVGTRHPWPLTQARPFILPCLPAESDSHATTQLPLTFAPLLTLRLCVEK
jgi:hypothetical protein